MFFANLRCFLQICGFFWKYAANLQIFLEICGKYALKGKICVICGKDRFMPKNFIYQICSSLVITRDEQIWNKNRSRYAQKYAPKNLKICAKICAKRQNMHKYMRISSSKGPFLAAKRPVFTYEFLCA